MPVVYRKYGKGLIFKDNSAVRCYAPEEKAQRELHLRISEYSRFDYNRITPSSYEDGLFCVSMEWVQDARTAVKPKGYTGDWLAVNDCIRALNSQGLRYINKDFSYDDFIIDRRGRALLIDFRNWYEPTEIQKAIGVAGFWELWE